MSGTAQPIRIAWSRTLGRWFVLYTWMMSMAFLSADGATTDTTFVRGFDGTATGGFSAEWFTHLGKVPLRGVRQSTPHDHIEWLSEPLPETIGTPHVTFVWTGAMGGKVSPAGNFTLSVNGHAAADLDVAVRSTRFLAREEGCECLYAVSWVNRDVHANELDSSGYFYLTVPAAWIKPGERATLSVQGRDVGSRRWFALVDADDAPRRIPNHDWETFERGALPPLAKAADPPPAGQEASYEWYRKQFADPGGLTTIGSPADPCQVSVSTTGQLFYGSDLTLSMRGSDYRIQGTWPVYPIKSLGWALFDGQKVVPTGLGNPACQRLDAGYMPIVITSWRHGDIELRQTVFAEPLDGPYHSGLERTLAWAAVEITNRGKTKQDVTLLGFYTGTNEEPRPELEYREGTVLMNGSALFSARAPQDFSTAFCPVFPADVAAGDGEDPCEMLRSHTGVYNALVVRGKIGPGETTRVVFNRAFDSPGTKYQQAHELPPVPPATLKNRSFDEALARVRGTWKELAARVSRFEVPEPMINNVVLKAMLDGYFLTKRWDGRHVVFDSIPAGYLCQWDDASTKWFYALDLMGDHATCEKLLDTVFERQGQRKPAGTRTHEGCFSDVTNTAEDGSAASWACCNGWVLWAVAQHARLTNDHAWLEKNKDTILAGCEWIIRERAFSKQEPDNPFAGLLSGRFTCDSGDDAGYLVYTDSINYLGLRGVGQVLDEWGHPEGKRLLEEAGAYRDDILAAVDRATDKSSDPWYIPRSVSDPGSTDLYHYGNTGPINLAFGGVVPPDDERIDHVIRYMLKNAYGGRIEGLLTGSIAYDRSNVTCCMFYSQDLAVVLLELGRVDEFLRIFYTLLASNVTHETLTTCEWRANAMPHIHSISSLIRMFRTMLIQERDGALYLLQGTPRRWLADGQEIRINEAPTWYGPLSLRCVSRLDDGRITITLDLPPRLGNTPVRLRLRTPHATRIKRAISGDKEWPVEQGKWLVLSGAAGHVQIECETDK